MACCPGLKAFMYLHLTLLFFLQGALGGVRQNVVTSANLFSSTCVFSVSSSSKGCVLEKTVRRGGQMELSCRTSEIVAENRANWVETDECIEACGFNRNTMEISSDSSLEGHFIQKLCSPHCYHGCPNIVDLYFNLAAREGIFLPQLCEAASAGLAEIQSSGAAAVVPESGTAEKLAFAPTTESEMVVASAPAMPPL